MGAPQPKVNANLQGRSIEVGRSPVAVELAIIELLARAPETRGWYYELKV